MTSILDHELIHIGDYILRVWNIVILMMVLTGVFILISIIKRLIYRSKKIDPAKKYSIFQLFKYFVLVITIVSCIQILGFNISILLAGSAALLVGIGMGLQSTFSDFLSGIIILVDSTIKVGDIIDVNNIICKVQEINIRTTTVLTRDDKYIIIPNSEFTKNRIINWTHSDIASRFEFSVGVDYSSDVKKVMEIIKQVAVNHNRVLNTPVPFVRFNDYADSSLVFTLYFWADEVFRVENIKSELRVLIYEKFRENGILIPFPQRVIHVKEKP